MALYDDLMAMVQADPSKYSDAVNQLTAAAGGGPGSADYRQIMNLASAAQGAPSYYTDTTSPVRQVTGMDNGGNLTFSSGISADAAANPYYMPGGAGYASTMEAFQPTLDKMQAAGQAAYDQQMAANSTPTGYVDNGNGSVTANFAGGGTQTVTDPNAMGLLTQAYGQAQPGYTAPAWTPPTPALTPGMQIGAAPTPPAGGGSSSGGSSSAPGLMGGLGSSLGSVGGSFGAGATPPSTQAASGLMGGLGAVGGSFGGTAPDYLSGAPAPNYGNGIGTPAASGFSSNPYLSGTGLDNPAVGSMLDANRYQTNLGLNDAFNAIRSNAIGTGGLGGTRQGVAQGVAIGRAMGGLAGQNANLLGGLYENQQNRDLSRYQGDQGFFTAQRGQDLQQTGLGANLWQMGVQGPWNSLNSAGNIFDTTAGLNTTGMQQGQQGGGIPGAVGGALGTWALGNRAGLWGNSTTPATNPAGTGSYDWTGMGWAF